jgi:hypothetical protein
MHILRRARVLGLVSLLWLLNSSPVDAGMLSPGGILTNEIHGTDQYLRRYSFDGQLTDELLLTFDDETGPGRSLAVVGSRVFMASVQGSIYSTGRGILELDTNTGIASFAFTHSGFADLNPSITAIGSNLLIFTSQSGAGALQEYTLGGTFVEPYFVPAGPYGSSSDIAYADGEIYMWGVNTVGPDPIGVFKVQTILELDRVAYSWDSPELLSVDDTTGDIWLTRSNTFFLYRGEGTPENRFTATGSLSGFTVLPTAVVPEPGTLSLILSGLVSAAAVFVGRVAYSRAA